VLTFPNATVAAPSRAAVARSLAGKASASVSAGGSIADPYNRVVASADRIGTAAAPPA
jgi:hypothetical protein